jgi:hypothetical protein
MLTENDLWVAKPVLPLLDKLILGGDRNEILRALAAVDVVGLATRTANDYVMTIKHGLLTVHRTRSEMLLHVPAQTAAHNLLKSLIDFLPLFHLELQVIPPNKSSLKVEGISEG